jgi:hypothetical protein
MRSIKTTYFASFLLGAVIALIGAASARSADLFRLDRIAIVQYAAAPDGSLLRRNGVLAAAGGITWRGTQSLPRPANFRDETLNRPLVHVDAWSAYHNLGFGAVSSFEILEGAVKFWAGENAYFAVGVSRDTLLANGPLINLSTRAHLPAGTGAVVAGFVIEERPRTVLIRAVGPTLARFGIGSYAGNPALTLRQNGRMLLANDDWSGQAEKDDVRRAAAHVGAFPLDEGSRDAASLVILAPGAYTVIVESADSSRPAGDVIVEIYTVPDTFFLSAAAS